MSELIKRLCLVLGLVLVMPGAMAGKGGSARVGPSDCRPRDADSTCAMAVVGATVPGPPPVHSSPFLYDGPIGGVPESGYAYWGFDFIADSTGSPSPIRLDEFVNRSAVPVTLTLTFTIPIDHPCGRGCLPGVQFQVGPGWDKVDPPYVINGNKASLTYTARPGQGYGWLIGLWQASEPRLTVLIPQNSVATLESVGLPKDPSIATEIPPYVGLCDCDDGTQGYCSLGSHFSNGLLGPWYQSIDMYRRAGAFVNCNSVR